MDQKELSKLINAGEESLAVERDNESIILTDLGQALDDAGQSHEAPDGLSAAVDRSAGEIHEHEESLRQILAEDERRKERVEESKTLKVEVRNLNSRRENALEDLGRAAWEGWKAGRQNDDSMEEALKDLIHADTKLHDAEVASFRIENEANGSRSSLFAKGKALLLAGRKRNATVSLERLWTKAGLKVLENVPLEPLKESSASVPLATILALDTRLEEIRERQVAVSDEMEVIEKSLEDMPGKGNVRKRVSHIEKLIEEARSSLDQAYRELGSGWKDATNRDSVSGEVGRCLKDIDAVSERIAAKETDLNAYRAHSQYLATEAEREKKAKKVHRSEQDIKDLQKQMKLEKKELSSIEKSLAAMAEILPPLPSEE